MKLFTSLILFCSINIFCCAQSSVWLIEGKGTTLYLGGTIHVLSSQDYPLPSEFDYAFAKSNVLVLEADVKKMEDPIIGQQIMMKSMYTDERTLKRVLNDEAYETLANGFENVGIPIINVEKFKPSIAILTLTVFKLQQLGLTATGVDLHFYNQAEKEGEKIFEFLESIEQQIDILVNLGEGNESNFIIYALKDLNNMEEMFQEMVTDWRKGSSNIFSKNLIEMKEDFPEIYSNLMLKRNNDWIPKIDTFLENKNIEFILVGVAHLHGPDGLLNKLKEKGYLIKQVVIN